MANLNRHRSNPNQQPVRHTHENGFVDDLPEGYLKAGLHLFEKAGPLGKIALVVAAVVAGKAVIDKFTK